MENIKFDFFGKQINGIFMEVLEHGLYSGDRSWRFSRVNSPFNRLYFILDGEAFVEDARGKIRLEAGNMYLIPLETNYDYYCDSHFRQFYIHFRLELFSGFDVFKAVDRCLSLPYHVPDVEGFLEKTKSERLSDIVSCKGFIMDSVAHLMEPVGQNISDRMESAYKYRSLYQYIKENCNAGLSVKKLSQSLKRSESGISKSFRQDTGLTLKNYIDSAVIQAAKEKILLTDMSIKEIAYSLKFTDEFYFSRFFKRHTGFSPREYGLRNKM